MNAVTKAKAVDYQTILATGKTTQEIALQWFDSLEPIATAKEKKSKNLI